MKMLGQDTSSWEVGSAVLTAQHVFPGAPSGVGGRGVDAGQELKLWLRPQHPLPLAVLAPDLTQVHSPPLSAGRALACAFHHCPESKGQFAGRTGSTAASRGGPPLSDRGQTPLAVSRTKLGSFSGVRG